MDFTITFDRATQVGHTLQQAAVRLDNDTIPKIKDELEALIVLIEGSVKKWTPTDTGALRSSIFSEIRTTGVSLEGLVSTPLMYGPPVEFGSKPHFPPSDALRGWARRKLGDENLAFVVARKIAQKGTTGAHMFDYAWEEMLPRIQVFLADLETHVIPQIIQGFFDSYT